MRKSWKLPPGLRATVCGRPLDEGFVVDLAEVGRGGAELEVDVVERAGAVVDDDLVDAALAGDAAVVAADGRDELVAVAARRSRASR